MMQISAFCSPDFGSVPENIPHSPDMSRIHRVLRLLPIPNLRKYSPRNRSEKATKDHKMKKTCPNICRMLEATMLVFGFTARCVVGADCGWQPEGGCIPCPPVTNAIWANSCPWVRNAPGVTPPVICQQYGTAPIVTGVTKPQYEAGEKVTWVTTICEDTFPPEAITYTPGDVQWDPELPSAFDYSHMPFFTSTAYVIVTNSHPDPHLCSADATFRYNIPHGTRTWYVRKGIEAGSMQEDADTGVKWKPDVPGLVQVLLDGGAPAEVFSSLTEPPDAGVYLTANWWRHEKCCPDGNPGDVNKEWKTASAHVDLGGEIDFTLFSIFPQWMQDVSQIVANNDPANAEALATIQSLFHFNLGGHATASGDVNMRTSLSDSCSGCSAAYTTGNGVLNISVNDSVSCSILSFTFGAGIAGSFSADAHSYAMAITPPTPPNQLGIYQYARMGYTFQCYNTALGDILFANTYFQSHATHFPCNPQICILSPMATVCTTPNL